MARVLVDHIKLDGDWCECGRQWISFEVSLLNLTKRGCRPQCLSCVCRQTPLIAKTTRRDAMAIRYHYAELHGTRDSHQIWEQQKQEEKPSSLKAVKANCEREEWICISIGTCFSVPGPHTIQPHQIRLEARAAAAAAAPSSDDVCIIVTDGPPFSVLCYFKWQGCFQLSRFYV